MGRGPGVPLRTAIRRADRRPTVVKRSLAISCATALLGLSACSNDATGIREPDLEGQWIPSRVADDSQMLLGFDLAAAGLTFMNDGTWKANVGCRDLKGTYDQDGTEFRAEVTRSEGLQIGVGCASGELPYADIMAASAEARRKGDRLELLDRSGTSMIEFVRAE